MKDLILETKYWEVVLAEDQYYLGRCYITLKRKCGDLAELKNKEMLDFLGVIKKLENSIRISFNATMFNLSCLMNNAYQEITPDPQVHWHFRPRYKHKVKFAGLIFEDAEFRHHYNNKEKRFVSKEVAAKIIKKINEKL